MTSEMKRRDFLKKSAVVGTSAFFGGRVISEILDNSMVHAQVAGKYDIVEVKGTNYFESTVKAIELLGGMKKFVGAGDRVGLLLNSPWRNIGSYTSPVVALAILKMCWDAGAKEVYSLENVTHRYWQRTALAEQFKDEIKSMKRAGRNYVKVEIPRGKNLKVAFIERRLMDCDVFINVPITKDHSGTHFTGSIKNLMGATAYKPTNRFMHFGDTGKDWGDPGAEDEVFLSQSIADLGLVRTPQLCVNDVTEILVTGGPYGPGKISKPQCVVAGTDSLAVESYCARFLNLSVENNLVLKYAKEHGLGEFFHSNMTVAKAEL
ncbi:MAG: DUF362 domain-containing protein [Candidatus Zhuqueibacterota bacterium]